MALETEGKVHLQYLAVALAKALSPDATYDHGLISRLVHFESHLFERDEQNSPSARTRLAASLVRIVATFADEQSITLPREDQVNTWFASWVSSGALRPLLPLIVDQVLDIEKVKSVINAMLLLRTVSPPSSPEPNSDTRQQEEAPASPDLDPFKAPPHTPLQPSRVSSAPFLTEVHPGESPPPPR